jgi:predicted nucleotidyltransferase
MTKLEAALVEVASLLDELSIPYMLIGGLAVSIWGEVRATLDADFSLWVEPQDLERIVRQISARLQPIPSDPLSFVTASRVLPVRASSGVRADLVFACLPGERETIARAVVKLINDRSIKVASVEDLIWMKLLSERQKDIEDASLLLRRFAGVLDRGYLEPLLQQISESFARADILEIYRREVGLKG